MPINYHADMMAVKMPGGEKAIRPDRLPSGLGQLPVRPGGFHTFWFALDEITPETGAMRFYEGSHKAGPLGKMGLCRRLPVDEYYAGPQGPLPAVAADPPAPGRRHRP